MAPSVAGHIMRRLSENVFIQMVLPPTGANVTDAVYPSTYIDVSGYGRFAFLVAVGTSNDTAVQAKVVQATAAAGTGKKDVSSAAVTTTTLAGSSSDDRWAIVEVEVNHLDIANGFRYVSLDVAATGGSATAMAVFFMAWRGRSLPPTFGTDLAEQIFVDG